MAIKQNLKAYIIPVSSIDEKIRSDENCVSFPINLPIGLEYVLLLALDTDTEIYIENNLNPVCDMSLEFSQGFNHQGKYGLEITFNKVIYKHGVKCIEEEFMSSIRLMAKRTVRFYGPRSELHDAVINPVFDVFEKHKKVIIGMINNKLLNDVSDFTDASELLE